MSAGLFNALRKRHCAPAWAFFEEVRNGTGYARGQVRTADAMAMSLWPSRGLELHGFEVKVSRSDWLREKDMPEKAEEIARFCDRWWLVTEAKVVADVNEVPPSWGWLEWSGKKLITRREAPAVTAVPLDKLMMASLLRRASESEAGRMTAAIKARLEIEMVGEREQFEKSLGLASAATHAAQEEARTALNLLRQLENALGETLFEPYRGRPIVRLSEELSQRLATFRASDVQQAKREIAQALKALRRAADSSRWALRRHGFKEPKNARWSS